VQLGFLEFEVSKLPEWTEFMTDVLGTVAVGNDRFRMDGHSWRFQLLEGPADDLATVGWEFGNEELDAVLARLDGAGHPYSEEDARARDAQRRYCLNDPAGVPLELVGGMALSQPPFESALVPSGFVADEEGLGHVVVTAPDRAASRRFYEEMLGFALSDQIVCNYHGFDVDLSFYHANTRHHSLAFGGPQLKRLHHFMVQAQDVDEVGLCYDRTIKSGAQIMQTLGRHSNDRMLSFYAATPSRFQFEFGWGARRVDKESWEPTVYDHMSEWGHHPPQLVFAKKERK
jgi:2,3-dihydroxybiphenyl 1,2-dioxygenase